MNGMFETSIHFTGVQKVLEMLRKSYDNVRVHFTNIASGEAIELIKAAQNDGLEVIFSFISIMNISDNSIWKSFKSRYVNIHLY